MILSFQTQNKGIPTNFVPKIWAGLENNGEASLHNFIDSLNTNTKERLGFTNEVELFNHLMNCNPYKNTFTPKIHTFRADNLNRWDDQKNIHMVVFNRSTNVFQFAPVLKAKAIQYVQITHTEIRPGIIRPFVHLCNTQDFSNPKLFYTEGFNDINMEIMAHNDGFESITDFFKWFKKDFDGKIIHWTDMRYE